MYLIEIIDKVGMEQGGMTIAIIKFKVKVLGNFSEDTRKFPISRSCRGKSAKKFKVSKRWDEKKTKDYNILSRKMDCNSRGRSPPASPAPACHCEARAGRREQWRAGAGRAKPMAGRFFTPLNFPMGTLFNRVNTGYSAPCEI